MAVDQRATSRSPSPYAPELMRMLTTASRESAVRARRRAVLVEHALAA